MSELPLTASADIGVLGGSGFYSLMDKPEMVVVDTPFGHPSGEYMVGKIAGKKVAFLPRHGAHHQWPPHLVNYRANLYGFKRLGVKYVISPCAAGSLQPEIKPGDFVVCDQFVDRTVGRKDTFFEGPRTVHVSVADPYCSHLRKLAFTNGLELKMSMHGEGTVVVINGPRFASKAESEWYRKQGWEVINMTQYPEVTLARELEMCFVNISLITDYDSGVKDDMSVKPVTAKEAMRVFALNNEKLKDLIYKMVKNIDVKRDCECHHALQQAVM